MTENAQQHPQQRSYRTVIDNTAGKTHGLRSRGRGQTQRTRGRGQQGRQTGNTPYIRGGGRGGNSYRNNGPPPPQSQEYLALQRQVQSASMAHGSQEDFPYQSSRGRQYNNNRQETGKRGGYGQRAEKDFQNEPDFAYKQMCNLLPSSEQKDSYYEEEYYQEEQPTRKSPEPEEEEPPCLIITGGKPKSSYQQSAPRPYQERYGEESYLQHQYSAEQNKDYYNEKKSSYAQSGHSADLRLKKQFKSDYSSSYENKKYSQNGSDHKQQQYDDSFCIIIDKNDIKNKNNISSHNDGGWYDSHGFYNYPDGSFYDPDGYWFNSEGYHKDGGYYDENYVYHEPSSYNNQGKYYNNQQHQKGYDQKQNSRGNNNAEEFMIIESGRSRRAEANQSQSYNQSHQEVSKSQPQQIYAKVGAPKPKYQPTNPKYTDYDEQRQNSGSKNKNFSGKKNNQPYKEYREPSQGQGQENQEPPFMIISQREKRSGLQSLEDYQHQGGKGMSAQTRDNHHSTPAVERAFLEDEDEEDDGDSIFLKKGSPQKQENNLKQQDDSPWEDSNKKNKQANSNYASPFKSHGDQHYEGENKNRSDEKNSDQKQQLNGQISPMNEQEAMLASDIMQNNLILEQQRRQLAILQYYQEQQQFAIKQQYYRLMQQQQIEAGLLQSAAQQSYPAPYVPEQFMGLAPQMQESVQEYVGSYPNENAPQQEENYNFFQGPGDYMGEQQNNKGVVQENQNAYYCENEDISGQQQPYYQQQQQEQGFNEMSQYFNNQNEEEPAPQNKQANSWLNAQYQQSDEEVTEDVKASMADQAASLLANLNLEAQPFVPCMPQQNPIQEEDSINQEGAQLEIEKQNSSPHRLLNFDEEDAIQDI